MLVVIQITIYKNRRRIGIDRIITDLNIYTPNPQIKYCDLFETPYIINVSIPAYHTKTRRIAI